MRAGTCLLVRTKRAKVVARLARPIVATMGPILLAGVLVAVCAVLLALFTPRARTPAGAPPRMEPRRFRALVVDLLGALGLEVEPGEDERRLLAHSHDPFRDARYVVFLEPDPGGDLVAQSTLLELEEQVKAEGASVGLLATPFRVARDGLSSLERPVELLDGERLRELTARELPDRLAELDRARGFGRPLAPQPGR